MFVMSKKELMGRYSIKELECLSGIKAHTLRIWEKRFNLLNPERTDTNIRYYSDEDLVKILNVSILTLSGVRISEIANFTDEELAKAVVEINNEEIRGLKRVNDLIISMNELDEVKFHQLFDKFTATIGFERTIMEVIYPYLEKVGILWLSGEVQALHEHLITNLIRGKLVKAIDDLDFPSSASKSALLFLPEGEYHEIALLFFHFLLKKKGVKVLYLGQSTPVEQVSGLLDSSKIDFAVTYSIVKSKAEIEELFSQISNENKTEIVYIENKHQSHLNISYPPNVSTFSSFPEVLEHLTK